MMHASDDSDGNGNGDDDDGSFTISYTNGYGKEPDIPHAEGQIWPTIISRKSS
jgi:hypothetical protein